MNTRTSSSVVTKLILGESTPTITDPWSALANIAAVLGPNAGCSTCQGCDYEMQEAHTIAVEALRSAGRPIPYEGTAPE